MRAARRTPGRARRRSPARARPELLPLARFHGLVLGRPLARPRGPLLARPHALRLALPGLAVAVAVAVAAIPAAAHERSVSYSTWRVDDGGARVSLRVSPFDLSRIPPERLPPDADPGAWLAGRLTLSRGDQPCAVDGAVARLGEPGDRAVFEWSVLCPVAGPLELRSGLLRDVAPSHLHFARILRPGEPPLETVLSADVPDWREPSTRATPTPPPVDARGFVLLGVEHILTGWDHLAFVGALLLGAASLADVARVITGFTLGHSLTLALASLGFVRVDGPAVEALIGASIALVALESLWTVADRHRWLPRAVAAALLLMAIARLSGAGAVPAAALVGLAIFVVGAFRALRSGASAGGLRWGVASTFGLIHGFGFASVLAEADLPTARLASALLGFNVGVELGQLGVVLLAWPLLLAARRRPTLGAAVEDGGNAALVALGTAWFLARTYG